MPTINRRIILAFSAICAGSAIQSHSLFAEEKGSQPNVLVFFSDDQRPSTIGAYGNPDAITPNIDKLADEGVLFKRAYMQGGMTGATCIPSRAMLHTGKHLFHLKGGKYIPSDTRTLGEVFRGAGYHTYFSGKRHAMSRDMIRRGYESGGVVMGFAGYFTDKRRMPIHDFDPKACYKRDDGYLISGKDRKRLTMHQISKRKWKPGDIEPGPFATELYVDPAVEFIGNYKGKRPFFMYVSLSAPHDPHEAPEEIRKLYDPAKLKMPPNLLSKHPFDNGDMNVRDEKLTDRPRDPAVVRRRTADYYAACTMIDRQFARLVAALKERGLKKNTIIVYMGDSGLAVGQHGLMGKQNLYDDAGIGIPWIMSGPGVPRGLTSDSLVCSYDLFPTLCELAGVEMGAKVDGRSVTHLFKAPRATHHPYVYAAYKDVQRAVIGPRYKLIEYVTQGNKGSHNTQLFDLEKDPWESKNLSSNPKYAQPLEEMRGKLQEGRVQYEDRYEKFWKSFQTRLN